MTTTLSIPLTFTDNGDGTVTISCPAFSGRLMLSTVIQVTSDPAGPVPVNPAPPVVSGFCWLPGEVPMSSQNTDRLFLCRGGPQPFKPAKLTDDFAGMRVVSYESPMWLVDFINGETTCAISAPGPNPGLVVNIEDGDNHSLYATCRMTPKSQKGVDGSAPFTFNIADGRVWHFTFTTSRNWSGDTEDGQEGRWPSLIIHSANAKQVSNAEIQEAALTDIGGWIAIDWASDSAAIKIVQQDDKGVCTTSYALSGNGGLAKYGLQDGDHRMVRGGNSERGGFATIIDFDGRTLNGNTLTKNDQGYTITVVENDTPLTEQHRYDVWIVKAKDGSWWIMVAEAGGLLTSQMIAAADGPQFTEAVAHNCNNLYHSRRNTKEGMEVKTWQDQGIRAEKAFPSAKDFPMVFGA